MHILWISYYPINPGEHSAPWITTLAKGLIGDGHDLTIVTVSSKITALRSFKTEDGYRVIVVPYKGGIIHLLSVFQTRVSALAKFLTDYRDPVDVIHIHGTEHQYASALLKSKRKVPYIISIQGIITLYKKELRSKLTGVYLFWLISSRYEKNEIRRSRDYFCRTTWDTGFVKEVNTGAAVYENWEMIRPAFFGYQHAFTGSGILFMGGKSYLKALHICLQAFDALLKTHKAVLHVVGNCDFAEIDAICAEYALVNIKHEHIVLHGRLEADQICKVYALCSCLYHPSLIDNSPNSVCEAQVAGLPVIATAVGGVGSLIDSGKTGMLVRKNDVQEHVETLRELLDEKSLQRSLSANALTLARHRHDFDFILRQVVQRYQRMATNTI